MPKLRPWKKFVTCGEIELGELNEKKKYAIGKLKDYEMHPAICHYLRGHFFGLIENILRNKKVIPEEIKCIFRGDPYHEFLFKLE